MRTSRANPISKLIWITDQGLVSAPILKHSPASISKTQIRRINFSTDLRAVNFGTNLRALQEFPETLFFKMYLDLILINPWIN